MSFYDDMTGTVLEMLSEFGQPVVIQQQGPKTVNANGVTVPSNPTAMTAMGCLFDYTFRNYGNEVVKGELVQSADKQLYMTATPVPPQVQDRVIVGGNSWAIVNIKQINPAGTPVMYELWLKR
jgi:hypothetical protein